MKKQLVALVLGSAMCQLAWAQELPQMASGFAEQRAGDKEDTLYRTGQSQIDKKEYSAAAKTFGELAAIKGRKADAALYWRAHSLNRAGDRQGAAAAIAQLRREYPKSNWINDAGALEVEMQQASGKRVDPTHFQDEDLQVYAINSLMNSDPERAVPLLINVLNSNKPAKVKERALFVLAESGNAKADETLVSIAKGQSNPGLQREAIQYIAISGSRKSQALLAEVYKSTSDAKVKRAVLQSYIACDCKGPLMTALNTETDRSLRGDAINALGAMGAREELHQLYARAQSTEDRHALMRAMGVAGDSEYLKEIAAGKGDSRSRVEAIRAMGIAGGNSEATLLNIYKSDSNAEVKEAVMEALFIEDDSRALISIAKTEKDPGLKRRAVEKLSVMDNKDARDYMMELLNQ
jgi:HEAT repeat protein